MVFHLKPNHFYQAFAVCGARVKFKLLKEDESRINFKHLDTKGAGKLSKAWPVVSIRLRSYKKGIGIHANFPLYQCANLASCMPCLATRHGSNPKLRRQRLALRPLAKSEGQEGQHAHGLS